MSNMYWLLTGCLLVIFMQGALTQEEGEGSSENVNCPPLKMKALRIMCTNADGDETDCNQPEAGTKARIQWRKNIVQGPGTVTDIVCKETGLWRREKGKGGVSSNRKNSDSDEDSAGGKSTRRSGVSKGNRGVSDSE